MCIFKNFGQVSKIHKDIIIPYKIVNDSSESSNTIHNQIFHVISIMSFYSLLESTSI